MRCCPPGRGCNRPRRRGNLLRGGEECLGRAARRSRDETLRESVDFWWERYRHLPRLRLRARREALGSYRQAVALAFAAGLEPRRVVAGFAGGSSRQRLIGERTAELVGVVREAADSDDADLKQLLVERRRELEQALARLRDPEPQLLALPDPKPPSAWAQPA